MYVTKGAFWGTGAPLSRAGEHAATSSAASQISIRSQSAITLRYRAFVKYPPYTNITKKKEMQQSRSILFRIRHRSSMENAHNTHRHTLMRCRGKSRFFYYVFIYFVAIFWIRGVGGQSQNHVFFFCM